MPLSYWTMWATRLLAVLGDTLIRSTALALVCLLVAFVFRRRTVALRHLLWHGVLISFVLMPVLQVVLPPIRRPALVVARSAPEIFPSSVNRAAHDRYLRASVAAARPRVDPAVWATLALVGLYIAGAVALLLRLATGLYHLRHLSARGENVSDANLQGQVHLLWLAGGCGAKPRVVESAEIAVPLTLGIWEPVIVLPVQWRQWDRTKREAVLLHEMAHVERNDTSTLILASLATCFYWFYPLAWILKRHLGLLAEQACDERVVRSVNPERYAGVLIEIARDLQLSGSRLQAPVVSVPMVTSSQMKSRLERILAATPAAASGQPVLRLALLVCLPALVCLSAAGHLERQVIEQTPQSASVEAADLPAKAAELETQLAGDLTNQKVRTHLMEIYQMERQAGEPLAGEKYDAQLLWMIANHPEAPALAPWNFAQPSRELQGTFQPRYQDAEDLWTSQLAKFPSSPAVLAHAAAFFKEKDAARSFSLYQKARQLDPKEPDYVAILAWFYAQAEIAFHDPTPAGGEALAGQGDVDPGFAESLHKELASSTDAALLSDVGSRLVRIGQHPPRPDRSACLW